MRLRINDMANPQKENGHLDIANEIGEAFRRLHLSGNQWQLLWVILRQTYGWQKTTDKISISFFEKHTGIDRRDVVKGLKKLEEMEIVGKNTNSFITSYGLQKDYTKWTYKTVGENTNSSKPLVKTPRPIGKNTNEIVGEITVHNKHINTIQKKWRSKIVFNSQKNQFININGHLKIFKEKFPCINIEAELRAMEAWLYANPTKRKKNYEKFIVSWLTNAEPSNPESENGVVL
ncbi:MAG: replication protein [Candidatus Anammoxibacter sp.]